MQDKYPQRTLRQNNALHLYCQLLADALNEAGYDMRKTLKADIDIPWTAENAKQYLFRPIMKAQLNKNSTTELTTTEVSAVFDTLNRHLGERLGVHVPFPHHQAELTDREGTTWQY